MCKRAVFSLLVIIGLTANVQTVNADISGKVSNKAGTGIANAVCTLLVKGGKATTGSDGSYKIVTTSTILPQFIPQTEKISLNRGVLELDLPASSPVKVEIFDVNGHLLKRESLQNAQAGIYRLDIAESSRAANLLVIHASIGQREMTFRYLPLNNNGKYTVNTSAESSVPAGGKLAKITAINDTLRVSAANYATKKITITSYEDSVNVTLDTLDTNTVTVQLAQKKQVIDGFGINNTWGTLKAEGQAIKQLYDSTSGLGLNILRIGMASGGDAYDGTKCWDDIKEAKKYGLKYIVGTCWTAPASMKTNNNENDGGFLKKTSYEQWATTIAAFPGKVKQGSGMDLYAMSPQNETDFASCGRTEPCNGNYVTMLWTGKDYAQFFKVAAPKIRAAGCKVMGPEASEWLHTWSDFSACCTQPGNVGSSDPLKCGFLGKDGTPKCNPDSGYNYARWLYKDTAAWNQLDILSTHQYDTQAAEPWPSDVPRTNTLGTIRVWQTEMSGVKWWPEQGTIVQDAGALGGWKTSCTATIENGVAVARWIHNALTVGEASAWCWWWWRCFDSNTEDNEGITCQGTLTKRYYTFGNFSKYVRPGMTRVAMTGKAPDKVLLAAFTGNGGKVVIVAINETTAAVTVPITISGGTVPASFKPVVTAEGNKNWSEGSAVTVTGGVLTAQLEKMSVTTFVSQ